jgi:hypothetical protein
MFSPTRGLPEAWIPAIAGLAWFWCAPSFGTLGSLLSLIPGCLLLASGVSILLYPGDLRIPQFTALGGLVGVPLALPTFFVAGLGTGLVLTILSLMSFVAAGAIAVRHEPHTDDVPEPAPSIRLARQVAIDEAILANMALRIRTVTFDDHERVRGEVHHARELFRDRGWLEDPAAYHRQPPPLSNPVMRPARSGKLDYERMEFDSGYEPDADEPGRDRWLSLAPNRTAHAWVLRHRGEPRPWLVCIHGYQMGYPFIDLPAFHAARFHHKFGLNLALPILPLHGPRKIGWQSGDGFVSGDFLNTVHAEAQAMWDMRRLLSWIRAHDGSPIGVHGLSLGGYNAALLASLEELACVIAGIPVTDFTRLTWRHGEPLRIRYAERNGLVHDEVSEVLSVVSPLALKPRVAKERRYIFAGIADRVVPPDHPRDLWRHWDEPRIVWYQGAHVTFRMHPAVDRMLVDALHESALMGSATQPLAAVAAQTAS